MDYVSVVISLDFPTNEACKLGLKRIKKENNFSESEHSCFPGITFATIDKPEGLIIDSDNIKKKGNSIRIVFDDVQELKEGTFSKCYEAFNELGTSSFCIIELFDSPIAKSVFFANGEEVESIVYYKSLMEIENDTDIESLFLPSQRTSIQASVKALKRENTESWNILINFTTDSGFEFVYRGRIRELEQLENEDCLPNCSFNANFELVKLKGKLVSLALSPTCIEITRET